MSELILIIGFIAVVETAIIVLAFKDVKRRIYLLINKNKGAKQAIILRLDKTVEISAMKAEEQKYKMDGNDYLLDSNSIFFDRNAGIQTIIIKEGDQKLFNPFKKIEEVVNPEIFKSALMAMYNLGMLVNEQRVETLKKLLIIAVVGAVAAGIFGFINMQAIGDLTTACANGIGGVNLG